MLNSEKTAGKWIECDRKKKMPGWFSTVSEYPDVLIKPSECVPDLDLLSLAQPHLKFLSARSLSGSKRQRSLEGVRWTRMCSPKIELLTARNKQSSTVLA